MSIRKILAIARRELGSYFVSPIAYIVLLTFLALSGFFFFIIITSLTPTVISSTLNNMSVILLFVTPAMTMRLLAEEQKSGTLEMVMTSPVRSVELVLGKFLAVFSLFLVIVAATFQYPLIVEYFGEPDWGPIITGYTGFILLGASFLSIGLFASSLTRNQIVAAVLTFSILLLLWIIGWISELSRGAFSKFLKGISILEHYGSFSSGIFDSSDIFFYLGVIFLGLFLTYMTLEIKRWK
jgi:gliding motility-associated transport system permease protein